MFHSHRCQGVEADVYLAIHQRASRVEVCCTVVAVRLRFLAPYPLTMNFTKFVR
jgi:hypothetical protein